MIVTLDGPAGSGKSSVARQLSERLGFAFLDTGAMYRAVAFCALEQELNFEDSISLGTLTESLKIQFENQQLLVNGRDLTKQLRTVDVSVAASKVALLPEVRHALVRLQREAALGKNMVTEGRDQGSVVFPLAECKFFLTADPDERARRRLRDLEDQGHPVDLAEVLKQILERDERDATREIAPLKPAEDALLVDTSQMAFEDVLQLLERTVRQKMPSSSA